MNQSEQNLKDAFAGESQANRKYLAFARKADAEGYTQVAKLFRATAEAETVHAHAHLKTLGGIKSTAENLQAAIDGETFEFKDMYPQMIAMAKEEGDKKAERTFTYANAVEKVHADLYQKALNAINDSKAAVDYYVCSVCGYTCENEPSEPCPVCKASAKVFKKID